jgi:hypothetical protein
MSGNQEEEFRQLEVPNLQMQAMLGEMNDENQQASLKDPLHVPVRPITRARSKMIKEAFRGLI